MRNFNNTSEEVEQGFKSGIVSYDDYSKYLGSQGYKNELKKSISNGDISKANYVNEISKAEAVYFERDLSHNTLRFTLRGADFQPMDLPAIHLQKAKEQSQLLKQSTFYENQKKINKLVDGFAKIAESIKKK
jgi:hypothetical protein